MPDETTRAPVPGQEPGPDKVGVHEPDEPIELPDRQALSIIWPDGGAGGPDLYPLPEPVRGPDSGTVPDPDWNK
jgi:hypothetical protein